MGEKTGITWTNKTFNPWRGCTKISPGCAHCYMFTEQTRYGNDPEIVTRTKTWGQPIKWNREAEAEGTQYLVFTCSWSDWFHANADGWRDEAWALVKKCPNLIFQILTKRSDRIADHLPTDWGTGYDNVWLGVSIENDRFAYRADHLRNVPAKVRFISAEPLLSDLPSLDLRGIQWLIVGGESGADYRVMQESWALSLYQKSRVSGTAFFYKQGNGVRSGMNPYLAGQQIQEFPQ